MNEKLERYKSIANSGSWPEIKTVILEIVSDIRDVANVEDIKGTTGYNVSLGSLFLGKLIASKKLMDIVNAIDALTNREEGKNEDEDFE